MLKVVEDPAACAELAAGLDEIVRDGARRMLAAALEAEVDVYLAAHAGERDEAGRRLVVRNGRARPRQCSRRRARCRCAPRVHDRGIDENIGQPRRFRSAILPPWCRRSPKVTEVLPLLYLHGLSSKDFVPALEEFFGLKAGLSASVISRLTTVWQADQRRFAERDLSGVDSGYLGVDGVHFNVRLDADRVCILVMVGVRVDGKKELVAFADGHRESTSSWADLLRDCRRRGMRAPLLAVGDGALGFWAALREVFPETREQPDWVHKAANVVDTLPKTAQRTARKTLAEIRDAEDREHAERAIDAFAELFGAKYPKAVAKVVDDAAQLLAFYDFPAEHWLHLKTSNPIESTFATVRLRTRMTKGPGSRAASLAMVFKLLEAAQEHWRYVNGAPLVALIRAGAKFEKGALIERPERAAPEAAA